MKINSNNLGKEWLPSFTSLTNLELLYANENNFWCPTLSYEHVPINDYNNTHCWHLPTVSPSL